MQKDPLQLWKEPFINVINKELFLQIVGQSQSYSNFQECSCGSGSQVTQMCLEQTCPLLETQKLYCDSCIAEGVHNHKTNRITKISSEKYFLTWVQLYSGLRYLQNDTNWRYVNGLEELVSLCENHLMQGVVIEGELLSFQIEMLNNTVIQVGEIFEEQIIPMTQSCQSIDLESLQGGLINLQKFFVDNTYLGNIDLEWVYKPYRKIFNKTVPNLPSNISQKTINLFTQLQLRSINENIQNQAPQIPQQDPNETVILRRNDTYTSMMSTPSVANRFNSNVKQLASRFEHLQMTQSDFIANQSFEVEEAKQAMPRKNSSLFDKDDESTKVQQAQKIVELTQKVKSQDDKIKNLERLIQQIINKDQQPNFDDREEQPDESLFD